MQAPFAGSHWHKPRQPLGSASFGQGVRSASLAVLLFRGRKCYPHPLGQGVLSASLAVLSFSCQEYYPHPLGQGVLSASLAALLFLFGSAIFASLRGTGYALYPSACLSRGVRSASTFAWDRAAGRGARRSAGTFCSAGVRSASTAVPYGGSSPSRPKYIYPIGVKRKCQTLCQRNRRS